MKKTVTLGVKVTEEMHEKALDALSRTSAETLSRFLRGCLADLIHKDETKERISEPVELLSIRQRQKLERE